jgi:hypothetical protein
VNIIDKLKTRLEDYLMAQNLSVIKFAMAAQINPISLYAWLNTDGYNLDLLSRAQIVNFMNENQN